MTNSFHNIYRQIRGAATLIFAVVLIVLSTLIIIFAASYGRILDQTIANQTRNDQAFQAAEAGLEFGISYLQTNATSIIANPVNGFINFSDSSTTNVTLNNGSKFSVVYTNPVANNLNLIRITSTGVSSENSATRVITQLVQLGSLLSNPGTIALVTKGLVAMSGNATVANTSTNQTIQSALVVTFAGSAQTTISSGTGSSASSIGSDVTANSSSLLNQSQDDFFANYFGTSSTDAVKSKVAHYYNNSASTNYSTTLNGMSGTSIWIDQTNNTATINGTTTIGTATNPVLLIVNGNLSLSGNVTIYGYVFTIGTNNITTLTGNTQIIGGMASTDNLTMSGNITLTYNPTVLNNLQNNSSMRYYAKVAGSWKDF